MAQAPGLYEVLGVDRSASAEDIRRAYRKLARENHPDVNKAAGAEERFKAIQAAYDVLKDDQKRAIYDRYGLAGLQPGLDSGLGGFDIGGFGDIFDAFFGNAPRREPRGPVAGRDLQTSVAIEFMEAINGVPKELEISKLEPCQDCGGSGARPDTKPSVCSVCNGSGQIRRSQRSIFGQFVNVVTCENCGGAGRVILNPCVRCEGSGRERRQQSRVIEIPAGVDDGISLRVTGGGDAGMRGGPPGDLYVQIRVRPHETFRRDGIDIHTILQLGVADAVLGGEFSVATVAGEEALKIEPGTQPQSVIKLRGKGVPRLQRPGRGDHYVTVNVDIPRNPGKREKQLYYELKVIADQAKRKQDFAGKVRQSLGR